MSHTNTHCSGFCLFRSPRCYTLIFFATIIISGYFTSCNSKDSPKQQNAKAFLVDSIVLQDVAPFYGSINFSHKKDNVLVSYVSARRDYIYYIDQYKKILDSLPLPPLLKNISFNYFVDSNRFIYSHANDETSICKFRDTTLIARYNYYTPSQRKMYLVSSFMQFEIVDSTLLLHKTPDYKMFIDTERKMFFKADHLGLFTLRNDSIVEIQAFQKYPKSYLNAYYNETYSYAHRIGRDSVAYLYSAEKNAYLYNISKKTESRYTLHNIAPNTLPTFNIDSISYLSYCNDYELRSTKFLKIISDDFSKNYIFIQALALPATDMEDGYMPILQDKPMLVTILDATFAIKNKLLFEKQSPDLMFSKSYYFNGKLYVPQFSRKKTTTIYVYKTG